MTLLPDLLALKPEVLQEVLQVGFEAKGPLRVGRVVVGASVSGVLASSEEQLAELREGSGEKEKEFRDVDYFQNAKAIFSRQ